MVDTKDSELIKKFLGWCRHHRFNQTEIANQVHRTPSWVTRLKQGKIISLHPITRQEMRARMGIKDENK